MRQQKTLGAFCTGLSMLARGLLEWVGEIICDLKAGLRFIQGSYGHLLTIAWRDASSHKKMMLPLIMILVFIGSAFVYFPNGFAPSEITALETAVKITGVGYITSVSIAAGLLGAGVAAIGVAIFLVALVILAVLVAGAGFVILPFMITIIIDSILLLFWPEIAGLVPATWAYVTAVFGFLIWYGYTQFR